ncbi:MAG: TonB-dependent receptor [Ferruginibacter sp.]
MKKLFTLVVIMLATVSYSYAQKISGSIKDEQDKTVAGASASLKRAKDSSLVKLSVSSATGKYEFLNVPPGKYFVNVSHVGKMPQNSPVIEVSGNGDAVVPEITLSKVPANLKAVVVTSKKPMIEVKADKTILNVEGSINAVGQDALELLRKAPGVLLDKDDNISLAGKNGVQIYVDGKPTPLSGADLTAYLKTIQSSQIEAVEIITNPSAKYEAAGNAGIINIRLKKNKSFGTNGSVNAGYAIGLMPKYNGGLSLNHRNKKINIFSSYNYNRGRNENKFNLFRHLGDTIFDQHSKFTTHNQSHGFKAGLDYFMNKKSTIGIMINGNFANNELGNYSRTDIIFAPTNTIDRILVADNNNETKRNNANFNLNYRYADTAGRELNMDADYGLFRIKGDQFQPNYYSTPNGFPLSSRIYNMISPTDIDIYSYKADYEQNFKKGRLGFGGKISYVKSGNDFQRYNVYTGGKVLDTLRSNDFTYKENINAVYVNYNRQFKGFMIQAGVRMENTNSDGRSNGYTFVNNVYMPYDSSFTRHYTDFFPSAAITLNKNPMMQWGLSYSRRIDRPAYQDLNPFEFKLDDYTFQKGNTQLRPQYTNTFSLTNTYKYKLNTSLTYSHVNDVFTQLVDTVERSKSFINKKNIATQDIVSLNISYPFQYKWYGMFVNLNSYYSHYKSDSLGINRKVDLDVYAFNLYMQHSAKLGKGFTAELSGFYNSPSIWGGTFKSKEIWAIDVGLQKSLWKSKANVKVSVSDVFHTLSFAGTSDFAGQYTHVDGNFESTQFKVNFTYRFGNNQVKAARQRKSGADDESKRVGSQGGGLNN